MTTITSKDGYFIIKGADKSQMALIQSAKYYAHLRGWAMPASPAGARIIFDILGVIDEKDTIKPR